ncbi:CopD family protein [Flavobacteriales bacterium]|nr:CopD family protein [Flavobacteriales bacterium]
MEFLSSIDFNIRYILALHIIFVVSWFAGLFYIIRLFIYHAEARTKDEPEKSILEKQYKLMEWRLWYIITWPAAILTLVFGTWMIVYTPGYLAMPWMHVKLSMVGGLYLYQLYCHKIFRKFQNDEEIWGSFKLRIWNEVATLFLFAIVFVVVLKNAVSWIIGLGSLIMLAIVMMGAIKLYGKARSKKDKEIGKSEDESAS